MILTDDIQKAEIEADRTQARLDQARSAGAPQQVIDLLTTEATTARHRYYAALNADLAL